MPLQTGEILNNRYRIVKLLGQGGFGAVYRAWDLNLETQRALKENLSTTAEAQRQFKREAQTLDKLSHPNLPKVIDHFILPGQGQYLVMEYVEGEDLQEKLNKQGRPLAEDQVLPWIGQICDALTYLHHQQSPIIHRDIKPANIKITPEGKAMLVDFGIAKIFDPLLNTTQGARAVTPGYSPPEQYGHGSTDTRSDVYALGATLYTLLTGVIPPDSITILSRQQLAPLPASDLNPGVSPAVSKAIQQALTLDCDHRFQSAAAFKAALEARQPVMSSPSLAHQAFALGTPTEASTTQGSGHQPSVLSLQTIMKWLPWAALVVVIAAAAWQFAGGDQESVKEVANTPVFTEDGQVGLAVRDTQTAIAMRETQTAIVMRTTQQAMGETQTAEAIPATPTETLPFTQIPSATEIPPPIATYPLVETAVPPPASTPAVTPVATRIAAIDGMVMVYIPAGPFLLGSNPDDPDGFEEEFPQRTIYLDAFWIDRTEVTNAMYAAFLNASGNTEEKGIAWLDTGSTTVLIQERNGAWIPKSGYADHPVIEVSWYGALAYCTWAGRRLPTEAEWEKAGRGENGLTFPWGDEFDCSRGNFDDETNVDSHVTPDGKGCDGFNRTAPVGSFPSGASPYGLFDMAGNVWEWVSDWYSSSYYTAAPAENPEGPVGGSERVLRSGSWNSDRTSFLRTANRYWLDPAEMWDVVGFRCAESP